ncbi:MAG: hypothetical protein EWV55_23705 [Microcystis viridis Mv_BB_P_19951000_S69]|uniref:Uncharacterized protein n=1 Tax=Microcystis viridis Mv_BB_P_19951000_S68D TaxID=2486270 RepID=A0A552HMI0_MICVR|nr:MAG: hypothetical protein EWV55_23705 [Microcystis viridis Mv_BB_P_19951000_S69]TRU68344.1 MAG: hypothetical protein EWV47_23030 [Microcystis viridis Mv_BB_P_19951000_S68]TRU72454.1 MAG: hypothetical protein EWV77_13595 [Microcystis viridis Mv_BB_P_19951000_S68D]TRU86390.1 MAG: hypothetical protein EWV46_10305 [Microcystis viridis Mv_BB_P_19951000_S69D]
MTTAFISKTIIVYRPQTTIFRLTHPHKIVKDSIVLRFFILVGFHPVSETEGLHPTLKIKMRILLRNR